MESKDCGCIGQICYWHKELDENMGKLQDLYAALKKSHAELLACLKEAITHSCEIEGAEFGWLPCCSVRDYEEHKPDCRANKAISAASQLEVKP
jgi:hypothetical protein